jgi:hypothetical protein
MLVCAALLPLVHGTGCSVARNAAGAASSAQEIRNPRHDPWSGIGVSPDADWIEKALRGAAFYEVFEKCPLRLLHCGSPELGREALDVTDVRCVAVNSYTDRCSFRLTETRMGPDSEPARSVRSRCTGHFRPVGTSHSLPEWELASWEVPPPSCTRSR